MGRGGAVKQLGCIKTTIRLGGGGGEGGISIFSKHPTSCSR